MPSSGSRLARALLRLAGWRLQFDGLPARQGGLIACPHTSNWDFVVGVLAKWALGFVRLTGDRDADLAAIGTACAGVAGRHPALASPVAFKE